MQHDATVVAYLRARPDFLAVHPWLYQVLQPPQRVHGVALADHMAAMLAEARTRDAQAERAMASAAADRRAADGFARRVHETVLALMHAPDPGWVARHELAGLLRVDAARLCAEDATSPEGVPAGFVGAMLGQRNALVRAAAAVDHRLHGEAAALAVHEALIRVPGRPVPTMLTLGCRDASGLAGAVSPLLAFLGQAVSAALGRAA